MSAHEQSDRKSDTPVPENVAENVPDSRSDGLLPGAAGAEDGRFEIAEEVSLDQQSDEARHIGQAPTDGIADALPDALKTPVASQQVPDKA